MVIEDGAVAHRPQNLLPNKLLQLTGELRRRAAHAIIGSARS
jgi:hypothetical protein